MNVMKPNNGRTKFWVAGYTVKISSRPVQYVKRYQYANMEHTIQTYGAVLVRSVIRFRSATKMHEKLCAVYRPQCRGLQMVWKWKREFEVGRQDVGDHQQNGRPNESMLFDNIQDVRDLIDKDSSCSRSDRQGSKNNDRRNNVASTGSKLQQGFCRSYSSQRVKILQTL